MRSTVWFIPFFALACSDKESTEDTGEEDVGPECSVETELDDCFSWEICESESCETGDRNNSADEAESLFWEQSTTAVLQDDGDADYFSFSAEGGEFVRISTKAIDEDEEDMDTILTLYTPIGKVHHVEDEYGAGAVATYDSIINAYLPYEGVWTVVVEDVNGYGSTYSNYEIELAEYNTHTREADAIESPSESLEITNSGSFWAVGVNLEEAGDVDYIELDLPWDACPLYLMGSQYTDGTDAIPTVEVYDSSGTQLLRKEDLGPGGEGIYPAVDGGSVILAASDALGGGGENYWFYVYIQIYEESAYELEEEPNDSQADAMELTTEWDSNEWGDFGTSRAWGVMDYEDDEDWFYVEVRDGHYLSLFGSAEDMGSTMDGQVEIVDSNGDTVASETAGSDDSFPDLVNVGPLDAGNYSIKVTSEDGVGASPMDYYRFSTYVTNYELADD